MVKSDTICELRVPSCSKSALLTGCLKVGEICMLRTEVL